VQYGDDNHAPDNRNGEHEPANHVADFPF